MGNLLVIDGAFGCTKAMLKRYGESRNNRRGIGIMEKFSIPSGDEQIKTAISVDLKEPDVSTTDKWNKVKHLWDPPGCYHYQLTGQDYWFLADDLDRRLAYVQTLLLVVRDTEMIRELRNKYATRMHSVYIWMSLDQLRGELVEYMEGEELARHLQRHGEARKDFSRKCDYYDHVLLNDGNSDDLYLQLDKIIGRLQTATGG